MEGSGIWTMVLCKLQQKSFEERSSLQDASYGEFRTALFVQCGLVLANVIHHQELAIERPTSESEESATSESEVSARGGSSSWGSGALGGALDRLRSAMACRQGRQGWI